MGRWLKGVHPVSTGLVVSALARPEWLVEIDATAVIADRGSTLTFSLSPATIGRVRHGDLLVEPGRRRRAACTCAPALAPSPART